MNCVDWMVFTKLNQETYQNLYISSITTSIYSKHDFQNSLLVKIHFPIKSRGLKLLQISFTCRVFIGFIISHISCLSWLSEILLHTYLESIVLMMRERDNSLLSVISDWLISWDGLWGSEVRSAATSLPFNVFISEYESSSWVTIRLARPPFFKGFSTTPSR